MLWTAGAWSSNLLPRYFTLIGISTKLTTAYHLWFLVIVYIPNFHGCLFHMLEQTSPKLRWISIQHTAHKELSLRILWVNWRGGFVLLESRWTLKLGKLTLSSHVVHFTIFAFRRRKYFWMSGGQLMMKTGKKMRVQCWMIIGDLMLITLKIFFYNIYSNRDFLDTLTSAKGACVALCIDNNDLHMTFCWAYSVSLPCSLICTLAPLGRKWCYWATNKLCSLQKSCDCSVISNLGYLGAYCQNSENHEHLKIFRNVDCVLTNHNKVQDTRANLKTTN